MTEHKFVSKNWLWQRARALETKLLKKYGKSLSASSIDTRFNKCVIECRIDDGTLEIDYSEYRQICRDIDEEYRRTTMPNELKPCPQCKEVPTVGYACGEYFILPISKPVGACFCSSFPDMYASKEPLINAWNRMVTRAGEAENRREPGD